MAEDLRYEGTVVSIDELRKAADEIWSEARYSDEIKRIVKKHGKDPELVSGTAREDLITIRREGAGLSAEVTAIIVAFAPVAAGIAKDIWVHFILPRLKKKFGEDALKAPRKRR